MNIHQLHPDDLLFFEEVAHAMRRVAKDYDLPLRTITAYPMPAAGMASRMGDCSAVGDIRVVMRCTVDGKWCDEPLSPDEVWHTAAHELAHLRHFNHGEAFRHFEAELLEAMQHEKKDHRRAVIDKLVKMQRSRQGEAELGNTDAAEAFAAAINRMMIEYELHPSDLDYARASDDDPVIELEVDLSKYRIEKKKSRIAWQQTLARVVADAHLCSFLIAPGTNSVWFVGTRSHATVAEYVYGTLVPAAEKMCTTEYFRYYSHCRFVLGDLSKTHGFKASWLTAFVMRVAERMREARMAAVKEAAVDVPGGESVALVRLNGALVKVRKYIDDKFKKKGRTTSLKSLRIKNAAGAEMGRAAADAMPIGRRAISGATRGARGTLKG